MFLDMKEQYIDKVADKKHKNIYSIYKGLIFKHIFS